MNRSKTRTWLLVLCAVFCGAYLAREPWLVYREQRAKANDYIADAEKNEAQRSALIRKEADLKNPIGREKLAREHGYVRKGEIPLGNSAP